MKIATSNGCSFLPGVRWWFPRVERRVLGHKHVTRAAVSLLWPVGHYAVYAVQGYTLSGVLVA